MRRSQIVREQQANAQLWALTIWACPREAGDYERHALDFLHEARALAKGWVAKILRTRRAKVGALAETFVALIVPSEARDLEALANNKPATAGAVVSLGLLTAHA